MAINVADNFSYKGGKPLDARTKYASVSDMVATPVADLYDGCLAYVTATKKNYQYDSTNDTDPTLGKWRELSTGGGGGASSFSDLDDVSLSDVQNGQVPKYNSQTHKWENADESGGGSGGHVIEDNGTPMTQRDTMNMIGFDVDDDDTNEKTEISAHRLTSAEMAEIFSAGLPGALSGVDYSNTTPDAMNFSTDEKVIGTWVDGKPLYQKTITGSWSLSSSWVFICNLPSCEKVVDCVATSDTTDFIFRFIEGEVRSNFDVYVVSERNREVNYITFRYTKTTDTAVSTGEKIIGQWVDGKPLYQKYVEVPSKGSTWQKVYEESGIDIKYCPFIQLYWNDENMTWMPMEYHSSSNSYALYGIHGSYISASTPKSGASYPIRMMICYTKN